MRHSIFAHKQAPWLRSTAPVQLAVPLHVTPYICYLPQRRIQGSLMGSNRFRVDMPRLVDFYLQGRLPLADMVSARIKLAQINDGFAALKQGGISRHVVVFDH